MDTQRRLKALLANQPTPEMPASLTVSLIALSYTASGPVHNDVVRARRRTLVAPPAKPRSFRSRVATYSTLSVALVAGVVVAGGTSDARKVRPPVTAFVEEHSATTGELGPLHDPAGNVVLASFP